MPSVRANLEYRCRECEWCQGAGEVTIFHERYTGLPYIELKKSDGRVRKYALVAAIPCECPLGTWIRNSREDKATTVRQLRLAHVIEGRIPWTLFDPTMPYVDDGEVPELGSFRAIMEAGAGVKNVKDVLRQDRKREQENWLVRFLVNALEAGPLSFDKLLQRARDAGRGNLSALRTAGELVRVKINTVNRQEIWSLE